MNQIKTFSIFSYVFIASACFIGCSKEEVINIPPSQAELLNGTARVTVEICQDLYCSTTNRISQFVVELATDTSGISSNQKTTNVQGEVVFSNLNRSNYIIRASYEGQNYIEKISVGRNKTSNHSIRFSPHCKLEGRSLVDCSTKIDFAHMAVGQRNLFVKYKSAELSSSQDKSYTYTGDTLLLEVVEKIDDENWLVRETFTNKNPNLDYPTEVLNDTLENVWRVDQDGFYLDTPFNPFVVLSYFTNYIEDPSLCEASLTDRSSSSCQLEGWSFGDCIPNMYPYSVENIEINGLEYDRLEIHLNYNSGSDGPDFGMLYSLNDGIVHTFYHYTYMPSIVYGFDLIK